MENKKVIYILIAIIAIIVIAWGVIAFVTAKDVSAGGSEPTGEPTEVESIAVEKEPITLTFEKDYVEIYVGFPPTEVRLFVSGANAADVKIPQRGSYERDIVYVSSRVVSDTEILIEVDSLENTGQRVITADCHGIKATLTVVVLPAEDAGQAVTGTTTTEQPYDYTQDPTLPPVTGTIDYVSIPSGEPNPGANFG